LAGADTKAQEKVCSIASAAQRLKDARMNRVNSWGKWVKVMDDSGRFGDQKVLDTLVKYADRANEVASLYLERGNLDAVDAVMSVSSPLAEGAL
jgi:hypothetical protein